VLQLGLSQRLRYGGHAFATSKHTRFAEGQGNDVKDKTSPAEAGAFATPAGRDQLARVEEDINASYPYGPVRTKVA
jgi:hypothetical protein